MSDLLSDAHQRELSHGLREVSNVGARAILGWRPLPFGIEVFHVPIFALAALGSLTSRFALQDHLVSESDVALLERAGCQRTTLTLTFQLPNGKQYSDYVEKLVRNYAVTSCPCRMVALYDIVGFSKYPPFEQTTQIKTLSYYIALAARRCNSRGLPVRIAMTTTGDGFYVWNAIEGLEGDIALHNTVMLALAYYYGARSIAKGGLPEVRCCVHFGSHFEFQHIDQDGTLSGGYIVGTVTIELARLMAAGLPSQILVGAHTRIVEEDSLAAQLGRNTLDTMGFLAIAQQSIAKIIGTSIPGGKIEKVMAYMTGSRISEQEFSINKYAIKDKHGGYHHCYNAKFNVVTSQDQKIYVGLPDKSLTGFKGEVLEDEQIRVRIQ